MAGEHPEGRIARAGASDTPPARGGAEAAVSVLAVDDDESTRRLLDLALPRRGYEVQVVPGGGEAVAELMRRDFDVLLTDIHMPELDGLELCEVARSIRPDIALVLMTGFQTEESVLRAFRGGACAYLRKPIELAALYRVIEQAVEGRPAAPRERGSGAGGPPVCRQTGSARAGPSAGRRAGAPSPREEVRIEKGRARGETRELLSSPELARWGLEQDEDGWISFEAPSASVLLERFSNVCELLLRGFVDADTVEELRVAILELGSNAIEWGNESDPRRPIRLSARLLADRIAVVVEDRGAGFRLEDVPDPKEDMRGLQRARAAAGKRPGGYGIALVRAITDALVYNERGNVVAMVKKLPSRPHGV